MKTFRQTLAVLALACIAPLAQAFTLSVDPAPVTVGDSTVLKLSGPLVDIYALTIEVEFDSTKVAMGDGVSDYSSEFVVLGLLNPALVDPSSLGIPGGPVDPNAPAASMFIYVFLTPPVNPLEETIFSLPFRTTAAGVASFSVRFCVMGAFDVCDTGDIYAPGTPDVVDPIQLAVDLTINRGSSNQTPEPGSLLLLGAAVLTAAGVARARRN